MAWLSAPLGATADSGVLILPPIGYPYWSSHRTLRVIAEELAAQGHLAMRLDYPGTGDSSGGAWDGALLDAWSQAVVDATEHLRATGMHRITLLGVRLGATLAMINGAQAQADAVVAWSPVRSGRRFAREIRLLSTEVPSSALSQRQNALAWAGTIFSAQTLDEIAAVSTEAIDSAPASRVLIIDELTNDPLAVRLRELGCEVEQHDSSGGEKALETPTEYATVPEAIVRGVLTWIGSATTGVPRDHGASDHAIIDGESGQLVERVVRIGERRLVAVQTTAVQQPADPTTVVFLNSGSEPHIGPGRAWVEYARSLAGAGHTCLRVDFAGWGESPDHGHAPGRPYDPHCQGDTISIVRALRADGHRRIVLVGLCASAWVALRVILDEPVEGVIALNPQMYWQPGDPVEATMQETRARRTPERELERRGARLGLWSVLDLLGRRPWAARWLDDLVAARTPVVMIFAEGDDGIEYLRTRLRRRLKKVLRSSSVTVVEMPEIDHSMHRAWLRPRMAELIARQVDRLAS